MSYILAIPKLFHGKTKRSSHAMGQRSFVRSGTKTVIRSRTVKHKVSSGVLAFVGMALVALNVGLLGFHIVQANRYAVKGYEITEIRNKISDLQEEGKKLSLRVSENASIFEVQNILADQRFVPVTSTEYLKPKNSQFSQR